VVGWSKHVCIKGRSQLERGGTSKLGKCVCRWYLVLNFILDVLYNTVHAYKVFFVCLYSLCLGWYCWVFWIPNYCVWMFKLFLLWLCTYNNELEGRNGSVSSTKCICFQHLTLVLTMLHVAVLGVFQLLVFAMCWINCRSDIRLDQARSQTMNTVGAAVSSVVAYMYIPSYVYVMLYYTYAVYVYIYILMDKSKKRLCQDHRINTLIV
jgi:hypothetical protein